VSGDAKAAQVRSNATRVDTERDNQAIGGISLPARWIDLLVL